LLACSLLGAAIQAGVPGRVQAQQPQRLTAPRRIDDGRDRDLAERIRPFFDQRRPESERLAALAAVPGFNRPDQVERAVVIVRDPNESPRIRALALSRVQGSVARDDALLTEVLGWARAQDTPAPLRRASLDAVEGVLSSTSRHPRYQELLSTLRVLARDPNADVRARALKLLAMEGAVP
jgi:hypothetical protein